MLLLAAILVGAVLVASFRSAEATGRPPMLNRDVMSRVNEWRHDAERESQGRAHVTTSLVLAVIARESGGNVGERGADDDIGLMQITEPAWEDYQAATDDLETVPFPDAMFVGPLNIRVGSWFLAQKIEEMGNVFDGLRAYNAGTTRATRDPAVSVGYAEWVIKYEPAFREPIA